MNAEELLSKAAKCHKTGYLLEAQYLYQEGIDKLMAILKDETNLTKKKAYGEIVSEYLSLAEQVKMLIQQQLTGGEIEKHIPIDENSTGNSYNTLFGSYLSEHVLEVLLEEPYLSEHYHFQNLIIFFELLVKKCSNLKYIHVVTKTCKKNAPKQRKNLEQIKTDINNHGITLNFVFEESLHDRKITLNTSGSNSFIIKVGRGLHFYKPCNNYYSLGMCDYDFRKCLQTDVDILRTKN